MSYASLQSSVVFRFRKYTGTSKHESTCYCTIPKSKKELVKPKPPKQTPNTPVHVRFSRKRTEKAAPTRANEITEAEQHEEAIALRLLRHLNPQAFSPHHAQLGKHQASSRSPPKALNLSDMSEGLNSLKEGYLRAYRGKQYKAGYKGGH